MVFKAFSNQLDNVNTRGYRPYFVVTKKLRLEREVSYGMAPLRQKYGNKVRKKSTFSVIFTDTITEIKRYHTKVIGRSRCHYGDSNERQKSIRFRLAKQQLRTCTKFFCTFPCRQAQL